MSRRRSPERTASRKDGGQATVEFALVVPLIIAMFGVGLQLTVVSATQVSVIEETRRLARIASLAEDPLVAALSSSTGESTVDVLYDDEMVTVTVARRFSGSLPLLGKLIPAFDIRSRLTMAREPAAP